MNFQKVSFGFFIVLAMTLNFGFFVGDIDNPAHHNVYEFFAVIVVNLVATVLKLGERSQIGALLLATSLAANLQLICAAVVWGYAAQVLGQVDAESMTAVVSLAGGALMANIVSVVLLVIDTARFHEAD